MAYPTDQRFSEILTNRDNGYDPPTLRSLTCKENRPTHHTNASGNCKKRHSLDRKLPGLYLIGTLRNLVTIVSDRYRSKNGGSRINSRGGPDAPL